jgi:hypothetical protein
MGRLATNLKRHDRDIHGGGLAAFIRTDIPASRRHDLECKNLENGSFIRLQRSNSSIKSKRVFPLFLHKRS